MFWYNTQQILNNNNKKIKEMMEDYYKKTNNRFNIVENRLTILENNLGKPTSSVASDVGVSMFLVSFVGLIGYKMYLERG